MEEKVEKKPELKSGVIGLVGAVTLGIVMLSPAMTLYGAFGPTFLTAGRAAPLVFLLALAATIPTALSYAVLSRDYPVSGSAAAWASKSLGQTIGVWGGWMVFFYYFTNFVIQPVTLGVFLGDLIPGRAAYPLGVVICLGWGASVVYRGISISSKGALAFLLFESAVVIALVATIFSHPVHSIDLTSFHLSTSPTGTSGVFRAMVFAMLAYCGFDVVSTLAEEAKAPKKLIPIATLLALVIFAFVIVVGMWGLTNGADPDAIRRIAESGKMPITEVAARYWGHGARLVTLTAISAALGLAIATAVGASRILYSMAREGLAPKAFATLDPKSLVPWNALHLIFLVALAASIVTGLALGPFDAYVWWGTTSTFFAMITYLLVNLSNLILNRERAFLGPGAFLIYVFVPLLGVVFDAYLLYRSFFVELWAQGWATGQSVILFDLLAAAFAFVMAARWRTRSRTRSTHPLQSEQVPSESAPEMKP